MTAATTTQRPKVKKPAPAQKVGKTEADFLAGRDLAVAMLLAAVQAEGDDDTWPLREQRYGAVQHRVATPFLKTLIERPALLEGFSAVLSARMTCSDDIQDPAGAYALPMAEYEPGMPGLDGTKPLGNDPEYHARTAAVLASLGLATTPAPAAEDAGEPSPEEVMLELARDALLEIDETAAWIAEEMRLHQGSGHLAGLGARMRLLSGIVFYASNLNDSGREKDLQELQHLYEGLVTP